MTAHELIHHEIFDLPLKWNGFRRTDSIGRERECSAYHQFIAWRLSEYNFLLNNLDELRIGGSPGLATLVPYRSNADIVRETVLNLSRGIHSTLREYANGSPSKAYRHLSMALEPVGVAVLTGLNRLSTCSIGDETLYRLREADYAVTNPQGLFHLPFELRHLVKSNRFSIAGYPTLYASTSALLALKELHLDEWPQNLFASRLRVFADPIKPVRLLDLRNRIEEFRSRYARPRDSYSGELMQFLVTWPLIMATSVPVGHQASRDEKGCLRPIGFHAEYVLPQLVLEWVFNSRNNNTPFKVSGIAYSSSRVSLREESYVNTFNIAVPAEAPALKGYCTVRTRQFGVSIPVSIAQLQNETQSENLSAEAFAQLLEARLATQEIKELRSSREPGA